MSVSISPQVWNLPTPPPLVRTGGLIRCFDTANVCGFSKVGVRVKGVVKVLETGRISGGTKINPPTLHISNVKAYEKVLVKGPLYSPLCFRAKGSLTLYSVCESNQCFQWEFPQSIKNKLMTILSSRPEYTTTDLRELLNVHRVTLPELGEGIDYEVPSVMESIQNQDRIKFHVLKSKVVGYRAEAMVRNWLVGVLEYNSYPCALFMNAYWDTYSSHPLRYILNAKEFREAVTYIKSLLFPKLDYEYEGVELYNTYHDANTIQFRLKTESYTLVLEEPLTKEALTEMDKNVSKFISLYTSYGDL